MTSDSNQPRVPRPVQGCELRSLPLSPSEVFVLSRIDGTVTAHDIAVMTGFDFGDVERTLDRLAGFGAVTWDGLEERPPASRGSNPEGRVVAQAVSGMQRPVVETYSRPPAAPASERPRALYDPAELDEDCDLPPERRRRILDAFYQLEELSYYDLLGVEPTATKKEIKDAYYEIVTQYHPDRYFRKNLGSFKHKMEIVFARVTLANDTLTRKQLRLEYDAYLEMQERTRKIERILRDVPAEAMHPKSVPAQPPPESAKLDRIQVGRMRVPVFSVPDSEMPYGVPPTGADVMGQNLRERSSEKKLLSKQSAKARREAFAARMAGGRASKPTSVPERDVRTSNPQLAAESLRLQMNERRGAARKAQIGRYTGAAQEAMERGEMASAAAAYQLAMQLDPDDLTLAAAHAKAQEQATKMLASGYLQQAKYEERVQRWKEAALSYMRAADGMLEDASVQSKAAAMMLRADLDLRKAAEYAKRATGLEPKNADFHMILGKIYLAAGLALNARREIELAAELAPSDATIASLLGSIRKGA